MPEQFYAAVEGNKVKSIWETPEAALRVAAKRRPNGRWKFKSGWRVLIYTAAELRKRLPDMPPELQVQMRMLLDGVRKPRRLMRWVVAFAAAVALAAGFAAWRLM